jgi:hypothetical protein
MREGFKDAVMAPVIPIMRSRPSRSNSLAQHDFVTACGSKEGASRRFLWHG